MVSFMQYISRIQFGFGALGTLKAELDRLGLKRLLVMADSGVVGAGILQKVLDAMAADSTQASTPVTFTDCPRHPTEAAARQALALYVSGDCDGIVAVGGGVVIDLAKAVALMHTHPAPLIEYASERGGSDRITAAVAPIVAIPTTAGTGSEIARGAGIAMGEGGVKAVFLSVNLVPKVAIYDPELTLSLPAGITAGTGIDALGHCLEAYLSRAVNPPVDAIALDGIARIAVSLEQAVHEPGNRDARWSVMMGALEGGMCFWKGLGVAHALSIPLDTYDLHHGTLVGMLLPAAVRFARPAAPEKLKALDAIFKGSAEDGLQRLNEAIGMPSGLAQLGVPEAALPEIASAAAQSVFNKTAPRSGSDTDYLDMLKAVY